MSVKELCEIASPGLMLSQTWPTSNQKRDATREALETAIEANFFIAFQTVEVNFAEERKKIAHLIGTRGYAYTYCITRVLNGNHLNLSDLHDSNRIRSYQKAIHCLNDAREAGADSLSLISGPSPENNESRGDALKLLLDSLSHIAVAANKEPRIRLVIEPLDVHSHKKMTLGYAAEALKICEELSSNDLPVSLCLDTAHLFLNGEDPVYALQQAKNYTTEFHYCNCVVEPSHPLYGDRHIRFGQPGVLDIQGIGRIMKKQVEMRFLNNEDRPIIMCEVLKTDNDQSKELMEYSIGVLSESWELAQVTIEKD